VTPDLQDKKISCFWVVFTIVEKAAKYLGFLKVIVPSFTDLQPVIG